MNKDEVYDHRKNKFLKIGRDKGFTKSSNINQSGLGLKEGSQEKIKRDFIKNKYIYFGIGIVLLVLSITMIY